MKEVIKKRIASHRGFDKKNGFDCANYITISHVKELMEVGACTCGEGLEDSGKNAWSIDRLKNYKGHVKGNCKISCRKCNTSRRV